MREPMARQWGRTRRIRVAVGFIGITLLGAAACTAGDDSSAPAAESLDQAWSAPEAVAGSAAATAEGSVDAGLKTGSTPGDTGAKNPTVIDQRSVIRTAAVQVELTLDPSVTRDTPAADRDKAIREATAAGANKARAAATGAGGYISDSDQSGGVFTVTARIPQAGYDAFLGRIAALGDVVGSTEASQDVTGQVADTASRIKTMRASVDRVRALLADAKDIGTVVKIESQLTAREADLDALLAQQATMANQVDYSTVAVTFSAGFAPSVLAADTPAPAESNGFVKGVTAGWHAFVAFLTGVAAVVGAVLPFLPVVLVLLLVVGLGRRWSRRRTSKAPGGDGQDPATA